MSIKTSMKQIVDLAVEFHQSATITCTGCRKITPKNDVMLCNDCLSRQREERPFSALLTDVFYGDQRTSWTGSLSTFMKGREEK